MVAGAYESGACAVWDLNALKETKRPKHVFKNHTQRARSLAFSPSGKLLASSSSDGTIIVRNLKSSKVVYEFRCVSPYRDMKIDGAWGLGKAQIDTLRRLGAQSD